MPGFSAIRPSPLFAARVKAVLGPTNTGKTHLAMERLLAHGSGIIGFPLRLLARENYDRMVARKGARHVALITGEEKIVPSEARWFACTVEAMPLDRAVEFVAVDEIQLCADPDRGHIFTDRLLHARGLSETMFLGAETIRPLLTRLVPRVEIETRPRLSSLEHVGHAKLAKLPPRTAVVAFSAAEVYAIAELIRRRRGGCAVVMGRLSPRTRNAQVALYQAKDVDFLVATDAIGMGLNMDVNHVAFAGIQKFDGHRPRPLLAAEIGQIAGRAGRGMRDGTFGTTGECPPLSPEVAEAVEAHAFDRLTQLFWRNNDLDFSHVDSLLASLTAAPDRPGLVKGNDASDLLTLQALVRDARIRRLADVPGRVRLLWDACQIPDFRKLADESHAQLCARVFAHIAAGETLPHDWVARSIEGLNRPAGDIDTLMQRLAGVRVWAYITARPDWVDGSAAWQDRTRAVENLLSDALHERLMSRFVDRRAAHLIRRLEENAGEGLLSAVTRRGEVVVEGHAMGTVSGFRFLPDPVVEGDEKRLVLRAARRALREAMPARVEELMSAPDEDLQFGSGHEIQWRGAAIARLVPGRSALHPRAEAMDSEFLDGAARERVRARVQAWLDHRVRRDLDLLFRAIDQAAGDGSLRGPLHRLRECLGVVPGPTEASISPALRARLKDIGVRAGRFALSLPGLLKPQPMAMRARLWAVQHGRPEWHVPPAGAVSVPFPADGDVARMLTELGWVGAGHVMVRLDIAERIAAELGHATRRGPAMLPVNLSQRLGIAPERLAPTLRALGFRLLPGVSREPTDIGPPTPPMIAARRRRRTEGGRDQAGVAVPAGPFAALAAIRS